MKTDVYSNRLSDLSNYLRSRMSLDGNTPSEKCGIKIDGNNKWITLIQNASKK